MAKITGKKVITLAIEAPGEANAATERYRQRQPRTGFQTRVGLKDVNLARDPAGGNLVRLRAMEIVLSNMPTAIDRRFGSKDETVMARIARNRAGLSNSVA